MPLSAAEHQALLGLIRAPKTPQPYSFRAHIILLLADGHNARDVARRLGTSHRTVRLWRRHWLSRPGCSVVERLQEAQRPEAPAPCSAEQGSAPPRVERVVRRLSAAPVLVERSLVVVLVVLATVLRLPNLGESFWYDEVLYSTSYGFSSLSDLWYLFLHDTPALSTASSCSSG